MARKFSTPEEVNKFFESWHEFSEVQRLQTIRELRSQGTLGIVSAKPSTHSFKCPVNGFVLSRPCQLGQCQYHMDSPEDRNCLVNCLSRTKHGRLSAPEVATVLNSSVSEVNQISTSAIKKIRRAIIKERIEKMVTQRYQHIPGHCVNCEMYIQDELDLNISPDLVIEYGKYGWCSPLCRKQKPKWQFRIEAEFGCHFEDAIWAAITMHGLSLEDVDQIFGLESGTVKNLNINKDR